MPFRTLTTLALLFLLSTLTLLLSPTSAASRKIESSSLDPEKSLNTELLQSLHDPLQTSNGEITPTLREAYLSWAESVVTHELTAATTPIPDDCLKEIHSNAQLREALFAAVYPPDPSILQRYADLRTQLGPALSTKYRSLLIAVSIRRRDRKIITDLPAPHHADSSKDPHPRVEHLIESIAAYMHTNNTAALDIYKNPNQQQQLSSYLSQQNIPNDEITKLSKLDHLGDLLKQAMIQLGQRPAHREPDPDELTWVRHLITTYESTPSSLPTLKKDGAPMHWPLFPIDSAPWPLMIGLGRSVPLGEATYMYETLQGQHGPDRWHTYGPYRGDAQVIPYELQPSPWHWDSWPDEIVHGGECVPISIATTELYVSLCRPALSAGQPGHANLISFHQTDNLYYAEIEQAFAGGPDVTFAQWFLDLDHKKTPRLRDLYDWAGAEYHLGLALGMNVGLDSYLDTRMATAIYKALPESEQHTVGEKLLKHATAENPFNPEPWYLLAKATIDAQQGLVLSQAAMKHDPGGADDTAQNQSLENPIEISHAKPVEAATIKYWRTVEQFVTRFSILDHDLPKDDATVKQIYAFLQTVPGIKDVDLARYQERLGLPIATTQPHKGK